MIKRFKIISAIVAVVLVCAVAAGCSGNGDGNADQAEKKETLYLFNSKGENAQQFKQMCDDFTAETGIPTSPFSVGSGQDAIEPLRTQMNSKNPPAVFSIQGLKELPEWQESGRALDLTTVEDADFKEIVDSIPDSMKLSMDGKASYGIPFNVEGYGYLVDSGMLSDLFGEDRVKDLLSDLKACSYEEFTAFCVAVDEYIASPASSSVKVNGNSYSFHTQKTGRAANLTGVFAFAGSEKWTYGDHLINIAINAVFPDARSAENATEEQLDQLKQPFVAYAQALEFVSDHVGGLKGHASRGSELINKANFGYDQSVQMYADGNALFLQQGNWAYANIEKVNADVAARSSFIPIKLPLTDAMIQTGKTAAQMNASIPVYVPNYYAINAKASETAQKQAIQFLTWMQKPENIQKYIIDSFEALPYNANDSMQIENPLSVSILEYMKNGNTLSAPYHGAPNIWTSEVVGKELMEKYLVKQDWTEEDYEAISNFAIEQWKQMKNTK